MAYVYKLTHLDTGEYYFGSRAANLVPPLDDLGVIYFTSSKDVKPHFDKFDREIVAEFELGIDAWWAEQDLIKTHRNNPLLLNKSFYDKSTGHRAFSTAGRSRTSEEKLRISRSKTGVSRKPFTRKAIENMKRARAKHPKPSQETLAKIVTTRQAGSAPWTAEATKKKISTSMKGRVPWNKGAPMKESTRLKLKETLAKKKQVQTQIIQALSLCAYSRSNHDVQQ